MEYLSEGLEEQAAGHIDNSKVAQSIMPGSTPAAKAVAVENTRSVLLFSN